MPDETNINVKGLAHLNRELARLGGALAQEKGGEVLAKSSARYIAKLARKNIKKFERTGNLRKSVTVVKVKKIVPGRYVYAVGNRVGKKVKHNGWYGGLVEYGTPPHIIKADRAKALGKDGRFGAEVHHPGAKPQPWLRPAFDQGWKLSLEHGRKKYAKFVEKVAAQNAP